MRVCQCQSCSGRGYGANKLKGKDVDIVLKVECGVSRTSGSLAIFVHTSHYDASLIHAWYTAS
jgi:hypothetical protein